MDDSLSERTARYIERRQQEAAKAEAESLRARIRELIEDELASSTYNAASFPWSPPEPPNWNAWAQEAHSWWHAYVLDGKGAEWRAVAERYRHGSLQPAHEEQEGQRIALGIVGNLMVALAEGKSVAEVFSVLRTAGMYELIGLIGLIRREMRAVAGAIRHPDRPLTWENGRVPHECGSPASVLNARELTTLAHMKEAESDQLSSDNLPKKLRQLTPQAVECALAYKAEKKEGRRISRHKFVKEWAEAKGESASSLNRILDDHPELFSDMSRTKAPTKR